MSKIKLSIIALSCAIALTACSSSSKGGSDNSDQIRQTENQLKQKIAEAESKAAEAAKKAEQDKKVAEAAKEAESKAAEAAKEAESKAAEAAKGAESKAAEAAKKAEQDKKVAEEEKKTADEARKIAEDRLKEFENLKADEKARIPLSDKVFGGASGEMKDTISGGTINLAKNELNSVLTADIRDLTIRDNNGKLVDINILRRAGEMDPESFEEYDDPYNLRKEGQTILSNNNFQASAFGTYLDRLSGNQYFFAQGNPTALAQIPTAGKVEYNGGAVYKKDGDQYYSERTEMTATADFGTKAIDINIKEKPNAVPGMNFGGKITGNSFAGEVNGIKTQGGFFGKDAQEMTGLFTNEADKSRGAFGGIKK